MFGFNKKKREMECQIKILETNNKAQKAQIEDMKILFNLLKGDDSEWFTIVKYEENGNIQYVTGVESNNHVLRTSKTYDPSGAIPTSYKVAKYYYDRIKKDTNEDIHITPISWGG